MLKPTILIGFVLTACGGSGGSSGKSPADTATQTAVATQTATSTSTSTTTSATKVTDIVTALASVVLCKPLAQQPAAVQALLASPLAGNPQTNTCGINTTCYNNKEWHPGDTAPVGAYSDGTDTIQWGLSLDSTTELVVAFGYNVDSKPAVHSSTACP